MKLRVPLLSECKLAVHRPADSRTASVRLGRADNRVGLMPFLFGLLLSRSEAFWITSLISELLPSGRLFATLGDFGACWS